MTVAERGRVLVVVPSLRLEDEARAWCVGRFGPAVGQVLRSTAPSARPALAGLRVDQVVLWRWVQVDPDDRDDVMALVLEAVGGDLTRVREVYP